MALGMHERKWHQILSVHHYYVGFLLRDMLLGYWLESQDIEHDGRITALFLYVLP
jgi:hypothetical protein